MLGKSESKDLQRAGSGSWLTMHAANEIKTLLEKMNKEGERFRRDLDKALLKLARLQELALEELRSSNSGESWEYQTLYSFDELAEAGLAGWEVIQAQENGYLLKRRMTGELQKVQTNLTNSALHRELLSRGPGWALISSTGIQRFSEERDPVLPKTPREHRNMVVVRSEDHWPDDVGVGYSKVWAVDHEFEIPNKKRWYLVISPWGLLGQGSSRKLALEKAGELPKELPKEAYWITTATKVNELIKEWYPLGGEPFFSRGRGAFDEW